jgi:hypothetical protein
LDCGAHRRFGIFTSRQTKKNAKAAMRAALQIAAWLLLCT